VRRILLPAVTAALVLAPPARGDAVGRVARDLQVGLRFVNLGDQFAESGSPGALLEKYGFTYQNVVKVARELL